MRHMAWICMAGLVAVGCVDRDLATLQPSVSRVIDEHVGSGGVTDVDLLLVIDDSFSMRQEQRLLSDQIPALVRGLTEPPDADLDGEPDWSPVESLRVAITTTDLGTSGVVTASFAGCGLGHGSTTSDPWGRDGAFVSSAACGAGGIQSWQTGDDVDAFVNAVGCLAEAGTSGCGFEQPLAAAARALSRHEETGFPRDDALLAVLVLTDEEDCSIGDSAGFFDSFTSESNSNLHCAFSPQFMLDVDGLIDEITLGRDPEGGLFLFAAIAGIPLDMVDGTPAELLAADAMRYVEEPATAATIGLRPACTASDGAEARSIATPGRRYVQMASRLPGALVRSICEDSFQPAIAELTQRIGQRLTGACLGRALSPDAAGAVDCIVEEVLPLGVSCDALPGRVRVGQTDDGRSECRVQQAPGGAGSGWYYDLSDATCDRVSFTEDAIPPVGVRLRFECLVEVQTPSLAETGPMGI